MTEQPVIRTCTLKQFLEILENNEILNENEWKLLIRSYIVKLIKHCYIDIRIKVKILEVKKEADETTSISILRTAEEDDSLENIFRYSYNEIIEGHDSEYSFSSHEDSEDLSYLRIPEKKSRNRYTRENFWYGK